MAHIIVVGNEKGGSGKSTTCMHVATALVRMGHRVGCLDLDLRQKSLGRYVENRLGYLARSGLSLPSPDYADLPEAHAQPGENPYDARLAAAVADLETRSGAASRFRAAASALRSSRSAYSTPATKACNISFFASAGVMPRACR